MLEQERVCLRCSFWGRNMLRIPIIQATVCCALISGSFSFQTALEDSCSSNSEEDLKGLCITTESGVQALLEEGGRTLRFFPDQLVPLCFSQELADLGIDVERIHKTDLTVTHGHAPKGLLWEAEFAFAQYAIVSSWPKEENACIGSPAKNPSLADFAFIAPILSVRDKPVKFNALGWREISSDDEPSITFLGGEVVFTLDRTIPCKLSLVQEDDLRNGLRLTILQTPPLEDSFEPFEGLDRPKGPNHVPPFFGKTLEKLGINTQKVTSVYLEGPIQEIGAEAFSHFCGLKTVYFPPSLRKIGPFSFAHTGLMDLDLSAAFGLTTIGRGAFEDTPLRTINWSPVLVQIGANAFSHCLLERVSPLPESVSIIGYRSFSDNPDLETLTFEGEEVMIASWAFVEDRNLGELCFPYARNLCIADSALSWPDPTRGGTKTVKVICSSDLKKRHDEAACTCFYEHF